MDQFEHATTLHNQGYTEKEIASQLGLKCKSIAYYLKKGKVPDKRKIKLVTEYLPEIEKILSQKKQINLDDLYTHLTTLGYAGSIRTLRRETVDIRKKFKNKSKVQSI